MWHTLFSNLNAQRAVLNFAVSVKFVLKFLIKYLKGNDSMEYVSSLSNENSFLIQVVIPFIFVCCGMNMAYVHGMVSVQRQEHKA